jgi:hypothetical protein
MRLLALLVAALLGCWTEEPPPLPSCIDRAVPVQARGTCSATQWVQCGPGAIVSVSHPQVRCDDSGNGVYRCVQCQGDRCAACTMMLEGE